MFVRRDNHLASAVGQARPRAARWCWWLAGGVTVAHVVLALRAGGPVALPDVTAYLSVASWAAGEGPLVTSPVYAPGFGLLLAPAAWLTSSADGLHTAALVVNGLAHGLLVVVAVEMARCLAASGGVRSGASGARWVSVLTGAFAATFGPLVAASTIAWPEPLVALVVGTAALCLARASGVHRRWLFAATALAGVAPVLHPRLVVLVGALGVSVALSPPLRRDWRWAASGAMLGGAIAAAAYAATGLWPAARTADAVGAAADGWLVVAAGQMIVLAAATFGVGLVGAVAPLWMRRDNGCWPVAAFLSVSAVGVVLAGALSLAGSDRADVFAYGRYVEPWAVPLVVVGLVTLMALSARDERLPVRSRRLGVVWSALGLCGVAVAVALVLAPDAALRSALTVMTLSAGALWVLAGSANVVGVVMLAAALIGVSLAFMFLAVTLWVQPTPSATRGGLSHVVVRAGCAALAVTLAASLTVGTIVRNWNELDEAGAIAAAQMADAREVRRQLAQLGPVSTRLTDSSARLCLAHDRSGVGGDVPSYVGWLYRFELNEFEHRAVDVEAGEPSCSLVVVAGAAFAESCAAIRLVPGGYAFLINRPPSTGSTAPVMYWLAGKQKLSVPCATSSGSA